MPSRGVLLPDEHLDRLLFSRAIDPPLVARSLGDPWPLLPALADRETDPELRTPVEPDEGLSDEVGLAEEPLVVGLVFRRPVSMLSVSTHDREPSSAISDLGFDGSSVKSAGNRKHTNELGTSSMTVEGGAIEREHTEIVRDRFNDCRRWNNRGGSTTVNAMRLGRDTVPW